MKPDAASIPFAERQLWPRLDTEGKYVFTPVLTHASRTDVVDVILDKVKVLPIVFVPGIMGSNLKVVGTNEPAWRFDSALDIARKNALNGPGKRQRILHPARTEVDAGGKVPDYEVGMLKLAAQFRQRGWGEVAAASYLKFLEWLELTFHHQRGNGGEPGPHAALNAALRQRTERREWGVAGDPGTHFEPLTEADCAAAESWSYPVHAFGYNWLETNELSATALAKRIGSVIASYNGPRGHCEQVILVTHSMGGLVARRCAQLPGMEKRIAGVVHGVMPAIGAAVAYRRCKVGMWDEDLPASLVIGTNGPEVTAVFSQAPGALELLPTSDYRPGWLSVTGTADDEHLMPPHFGDSYDSIYLERHRWWGLINEAWLKPVDGIATTWTDFTEALKLARTFHKNIRHSYHPNSWAFYGTGVHTFNRLTWTLEDAPSESPPSRGLPTARVANLTHAEMQLRGHNPEVVPLFKDSPADIHATGKPRQLQMRLRRANEAISKDEMGKPVFDGDQTGDGTVPASSGQAPKPYMRQLFAVHGVQHEPAYNAQAARDITAFAIAKIAAAATSSTEILRRKTAV